MIKAIIFDCFGVLYPDTYWTLARKYLKETFAEHYQELHDLVTQVDLGFITRDQLWERFADIVGSTKDAVYEELKDMGGLDSRLLSFIETNHETYKFGMISNVGHGFIERMFTEKPVEHYFDAVVLSSDVGLVKPDKEIYLLGAKKLRCQPEECVFIDDLEKNVRGAEAAGMKAIHYTDYDAFLAQFGALLEMSDTDE